MVGIKNSELLDQLIEASKKIGNVQNPPFTAERFLVALIDKINTSDTGRSCEELSTAAEVVEKAFTDPSAAREALFAYVCRENGSSFLDDLYMKKRIIEVKNAASKYNAQTIDVVALLLAIVNEPSKVIEPFLNYDIDSLDAALEEPSDDGGIAEALGATIGELFGEADSDPDDYKTCSEPDDDWDDDDSFISETIKSDMAFLINDVKRIRRDLKRSVYGQDNAINVFVTGYFRARLLSMIDRSRIRPQATFLFAGPPGVGKTFLAEEAANILGLPFMRFDMSEYCDKEAALEFSGSDSVFKGNKPGNFTSFVNEHPKSIVLLDEIEKAHISIIHLFLQVLDAGRLRDSNTDREISFRDTILIFTTNAGKQLYNGSEDGDMSAVSRKVIIDALEKDVNPLTGVPYFPSAICSRFASGNVVMFNGIGAHDLHRVAKKEIVRQANNLQNETGISMEIDDRVYTALLFSEGAKADARNIKSRAEAFFNDELYELLRFISSSKTSATIENIEKIRIDVDLSDASNSVRELFAAEREKCVLVLSDEKTVSLCKSKKPESEIIGVQSCRDAIEILKTKEIDLLILDVKFGTNLKSCPNLNIEDANTPARELLHSLREQRNAPPVYLLECGKNFIDEEEKVSYAGHGVRGAIKLSKAKNDDFASRLNEILTVIHQQNGISKLAKENKLVSFETSQSVSKNKKIATIRLFDFKTSIAIDAEDSRNILSAISRPNVHFDDIIGANEAKKELMYFVEYLRNPKKYLGTGVKAPKGMLLYGPPGTGKTMLAKAMACEAEVTFIAAEGNQFLKKYVGEGSEKVHELFKIARKYAPSILFIDEIDAIAKERRGGSNSGANGEETLTAFLTEMDGFVTDPSRPVFVLAATNFDVEPGQEKSLDPSLMRRFDRRVFIDLPNSDDRTRFLKQKFESNKTFDVSDKLIGSIAIRSTGMSLAELDSVTELALRSAIREGSVVVNDEILEEAFETFNGGEIKKWDVSQLERVARHEAGHALICWLSGETPTYLTVVARGNHGGYMQCAEREGKAIYTKDELLARIRTALGGRAAEIVYYGERDGVSTGASGDLDTATDIARQIVCTFGMVDSFGLSVIGIKDTQNGVMSVEVRNAVNAILKEQMTEAIRLISENKEKIDSLTAELITRNHLNGAEITKAITKS